MIWGAYPDYDRPAKNTTQSAKNTSAVSAATVLVSKQLAGLA
jgi:hypothetical protein